jgi:hypothetical protein
VNLGKMLGSERSLCTVHCAGHLAYSVCLTGPQPSGCLGRGERHVWGRARKGGRGII